MDADTNTYYTIVQSMDGDRNTYYTCTCYISYYTYEICKGCSEWLNYVDGVCDKHKEDLKPIMKCKRYKKKGIKNVQHD